MDKAGKLIEKSDKFIRIVTISPVMALLLLLTLFFAVPSSFGSVPELLFAILFICVLPVLAYPIQPFIPGFRGKGRKGQRDLAIVMSVIGYVCGIIHILLSDPKNPMLVVYLTYLLSGAGIALFSALTPIKASGHACGVAGPIAAVTYFVGLWGLMGIIIYILMFVSSLRMKRHTIAELIAGTILPVIAMFVSIFVYGLIG